MSDFKDLATSLKRKAQAIRVNSDELVKTVAKDILREVVESTPVDVGTASSNWIVAINYFSNYVIEARIPGEKRSTEAINKALTISDGENAIDHRQEGQSITISNNVPYINDLNSGTSNQAEPMYVQDAILNAISNIAVSGYFITTNIPGSK